MAGKNTQNESIDAPQEEETDQSVVTPFDPSPLLARIDTIERGQKILTDTVNFVKDTNFLLLVVLGLGFVALIFTLISGIIQANNSSTSAQIEFIKSVENLQNEVNNLKTNLPQPTATSTPINVVIPNQ